MTPAPAPPSAPQARPSGCSQGCLIALLIVGGVGLLTALVAAVALWRAASSPEGKRVLAAVGKGAAIAGKGLNAPGAAEVRALGCPEAFVLDLGDMADLVSLFDDGGARAQLSGVLVMCQGRVGELPSCDEVAQTYAAAPGRPPGGFVVTVKRSHQKGEACSRRYDAQGADLGPFGSGQKQ